MQILVSRTFVAVLRGNTIDNYPKGELSIYKSEDGRTKIDVFFEDDTIWLNQKQIAKLYQKGINTINEHIKHIFGDGELEVNATIRKFRIVHKEGKREVSREIDYYNLNMILEDTESVPMLATSLDAGPARCSPSI
ncbi:putative dna-binding protein in cluster with type i restriction-modification system [hydrocarbon metagenome]|uniref:Putative dna-binding protein in cluster with type i restriction-modification system n=1 Tax=hydrocarbon metagenome TaxID=938273 RepID=A0A0W8E2Y2_9ZZZZ